MDVAYFSKRVSNFVKTALSSISPNKVVAYTQTQYETEYQGCEVLYEQNSLFYFYKVANHFEMVYIPKAAFAQNAEEAPFAFSLFRFQGDEEAGLAAFVRHFEVLGPLHEAHVTLRLPYDRLAIEKVTTLCREQCGWSAAHVAASLSWQEVFKSSAVESLLNRYDPLSGMTPLRIAIAAKDLNLVEFLLSLPGICLAGADENGCTVLHAAAAHGSAKLLSLLLPRLDQQVDINAVNNDGNTALHVACIKPTYDCIELLLNAGANPLIGTTDLPLHQAVVANSIECVDLIYRHCPQALDYQQPSTLDYPIHLASKPTMFRRLNELGANLDAQNSSGLTVLHIKVRENDLDGVLNLLTQGVDPNLGDNDGATPLHYAIMFNASIHIIRALIVFECDPCALDNRWRSPRHLLCSDPKEYVHSKEKDLSLYTLHAVGAKRCSPTLEDCTAGCMDSDVMRLKQLQPFDGTAPEVTHHSHEDAANLFEEIFFSKHQPDTRVAEEENSDSESTDFCSTTTVSTNNGFERPRSSHFSRSLRRFSRRDLTFGSVSTLRAPDDDLLPGANTPSSSPEAKRMASNRSRVEFNRRMSYQVQSNPTSPQRASIGTCRFTLHSDDETAALNARTAGSQNSVVRPRPPCESAGDRPARVSRANDSHAASARLRFIPSDCCCDEEFLNELNAPDAEIESQQDPTHPSGTVHNTDTTADQYNDIKIAVSQSEYQPQVLSQSSSSPTLNMEEDAYPPAHTSYEHLSENSSPSRPEVVSDLHNHCPASMSQTRLSTAEAAKHDWSCGPHGYRVLSLDGGGVRGLILVQLLRALEKATDRRVTDLFDWIMGTSTGGVLSLLLLRGKCLRCCRNLLFSFKDLVFCGRRPYSAEGLEKVFRRELGEKTVMTDLKGIRVAVTTLVSDRCPPVLHLFRNYTSPRTELHNILLENQRRSSTNAEAFDRSTMLDRRRSSRLRYFSGTGTGDAQTGRATSLTYSSSLLNFLLSGSGFQNAGDAGNTPGSSPETESGHKFDPMIPDSEMLVWKAARATGAAPTYFRPCGRFLDGGLIANNPTLDLLTELQEQHMAQQLKRKPVAPLAVVVSLGTGRMPVEPIETVDVFRPQSLMETFRSAMGFSSLGRIIVETATMSEGPVVDRASAWCASLGVPYFRLSPRLSLQINLDTIDTKELLQMVWETEAYIYRARDRINQLASIL